MVLPEFGAEARREQGKHYPNLSPSSLRSPTRPMGSQKIKMSTIAGFRVMLKGHKADREELRLYLQWI